MKSPTFFALAIVLAGLSSATATTITFEDAGSTEGSDLGNFYPGVTFGPDIQVVNSIPGLFPAHSGIYQVTDNNIFNPVMSIAFAVPQSSLSFWYTAFYGATITTYAANSSVIQTFVVGANGGTDSLFSVTDGTNNIASFSLVDPSELGNSLTLDDLSYPAVAASVPETASTFGLLAVAALGLAACRKQVVA